MDDETGLGKRSPSWDKGSRGQNGERMGLCSLPRKEREAFELAQTRR